MSIQLQKTVRTLQSRVEQLEASLATAIRAIQDLEEWRILHVGKDKAIAQGLKLTVSTRKHA